jgi:argininosuccinate lyase
VVGLAEKAAKPLNRVTLEEFKGISDTFGDDVLETFDLDQAMKRRQIPGAPGTREVQRELSRWLKLLQK